MPVAIASMPAISAKFFTVTVVQLICSAYKQYFHARGRDTTPSTDLNSGPKIQEPSRMGHMGQALHAIAGRHPNNCKTPIKICSQLASCPGSLERH